MRHIKLKEYFGNLKTLYSIEIRLAFWKFRKTLCKAMRKELIKFDATIGLIFWQKVYVLQQSCVLFTWNTHSCNVLMSIFSNSGAVFNGLAKIYRRPCHCNLPYFYFCVLFYAIAGRCASRWIYWQIQVRIACSLIGYYRTLRNSH